MADDTYQPLVYRKQGGTEFVVASGGDITVEDGGDVNVESGGYITVESGGYINTESGGIINVESGGTVDIESGANIAIDSGGSITAASGGQIIWPVSGATSSSVGSTTLTEFANSGISIIESSADVRMFYVDYPYPGASKWIFNTAGATQMHYYVSVSTAATPDVGIITTGGESTSHLMIIEGTTSGALAGYCHLIGWSTSKWIRAEFQPTSQWVIASTSS